MRIESVFFTPGADGLPLGLDQLADEEPTPEFSGQIAAEVSRLLSALNVEDENLRQVALLNLEGYTNDEIAERLATTCRTVQRWLNRIRESFLCESRWNDQDLPDAENL